jgi:hypothetical protein
METSAPGLSTTSEGTTEVTPGSAQANGTPQMIAEMKNHRRDGSGRTG